MGKKVIDHRTAKPNPKDANTVRQAVIEKSKSLKRVIKHNTYTGFFLSNEQLIELGKKLSSSSEPSGSHPDGVFIMIGDASTKPNDFKETIEIIPMKLDDDGRVTFYEEDNVVGQFSVHLGNANVAGYLPFTINGDGVSTIIGTEGVSQRTPPPRSTN